MDILSQIEEKEKVFNQLKNQIKRIESHTYSECVSHEDLLLLDREKLKLLSELDQFSQRYKSTDKIDRILDKFDLDIEKIKTADVEYLIDGFIVKHEVTLFAAKPSSGKSLCSCAVANMALLSGKINIVVYFDADNGATTLSERGIPVLKELHGSKFRYIHDTSASKSEMFQLIKALESIDLHGYLIIFDSIKNFMSPGGDRSSNKDVSLLLDMTKRLRRQGATVFVLHHTNKPQKDFQELTYAGSSAFEEDVSNAYMLKYNSHRKAFIFKPFKNRVGQLQEKAFCYESNSKVLKELDLFWAKETPENEMMRIEIIEFIKSFDGAPNYSQIMKYIGDMGFAKDRINETIQSGKGRYWMAKKIKEQYNKDVFELIAASKLSDKTDNYESPNIMESLADNTILDSLDNSYKHCVSNEISQ